MGISESHSLTGQTIDVGRHNFFRPIAAQITVAKIVCKDDDDIGRVRLIAQRDRRVLENTDADGKGN